MFYELQRLIRHWKLLSFRKFLFFPHVLGRREKQAFFLFFVLAFVSGSGFLFRIYLSLTHAVPDIGGSYIEGVRGEPHMINPVFALGDTDRDIARLVFSGLLMFDGNGAVKEGLAKRYDIDEEGKVYTVTLREGVVWHDGEKFDAEDVLFTINTIQNPNYRSPLRANWQGVEVEALDPYTVRFSLRAAYAPFIENLTVGIIPKHVWEHVVPEQAYLHERNLKPIGTGPYQFDAFTQQKDGTFMSYRLRRNKNFYGAGPYLEKVQFVFFKNEDELRTAKKRGEIDGYGPISHVAFFDGEENAAHVVPLQMPRVFGLFFNQKKAPLLENKSIREAIARSLNRKEIAQFAASDGAVPHAYPLPPLVTNANGIAQQYGFDPERARGILEENFWTDDDGDGVREKLIRKNKKEKAISTPLSFTLTTSDWPDLMRAAERVKSSLNEVGIGIVINIIPFSDLEQRTIKSRDFEVLLFGHVYGYEPDPFTFWHSSQIKDPGLNITLFADKRADALLEEARKTNDPIVRDNDYREFQKIVLEEIPAVFLYSQLYLYLLPNNLAGVSLTKISLPSDRFNTAHEWYKETKRVFQ